MSQAVLQDQNTTRTSPQVIDLDELIPQTQRIKLDGKEHDVVPPSVEMYLKVMKARQRMKNADTEIEHIEQAIELIVLAVPTISRDRLVRLQIQPLNRLADIVMEMMSDGSEEEEAVSPDGKTSGE